MGGWLVVMVLGKRSPPPPATKCTLVLCCLNYHKICQTLFYIEMALSPWVTFARIPLQADVGRTTPISDPTTKGFHTDTTRVQTPLPLSVAPPAAGGPAPTALLPSPPLVRSSAVPPVPRIPPPTRSNPRAPPHVRTARSPDCPPSSLPPHCPHTDLSDVFPHNSATPPPPGRSPGSHAHEPFRPPIRFIGKGGPCGSQSVSWQLNRTHAPTPAFIPPDLRAQDLDPQIPNRLPPWRGGVPVPPPSPP